MSSHFTWHICFSSECNLDAVKVLKILLVLSILLLGCMEKKTSQTTKDLFSFWYNGNDDNFVLVRSFSGFWSRNWFTYRCLSLWLEWQRPSTENILYLQILLSFLPANNIQGFKMIFIQATSILQGPDCWGRKSF